MLRRLHDAPLSLEEEDLVPYLRGNRWDRCKEKEDQAPCLCGEGGEPTQWREGR